MTSIITSAYVTWLPGEREAGIAAGGGVVCYAIRKLAEARISHLDVYAFQPDDAPWLQSLAGKSHAAHSLLAEMARMDPHRVGDAIRRCADRAGLCSGWATAVATNLPGISSLRDDLRKKTIGALKKTVAMAAFLDAPVVEIVAGGDVDWPGNTEEDRDALVGPRVRDERFRMLTKSLRILNEFLEEEDMPVTLALEFEPGLSYLVSTPDELDLFLRETAAYRHVQVNFDCGHAMLFQNRDYKKMCEIFARTQARSRIVHAHASRHGSFHGADLYLRPEDRDSLMPWINLVVDAYMMDSAVPSRSFCIALELEACSSIGLVNRSLDLLNSWVDESKKRYQGLSWRYSLDAPKDVTAVVLFLDIVGSTKLIREEAFWGALKSMIALCSERIEAQSGGYMDKFTGDGVMALFVSPEDCASLCRRIAAFAVELVPRVNDIFKATVPGYTRCQIGIACGSVWLGDFGAGSRAEVTAVGAPVVEASRLCSYRKKEFATGVLAATSFAEHIAPVHKTEMGRLTEADGLPRDTGVFGIKATV